jgi:integrase
MKRANGEGTMRQRSDGRWESRINVNGRVHSYYGASQREVKAKLNAAKEAQRVGLSVVPQRQTVAGFFAEWLMTVKPTLKPRTWQRYEQFVRIHIAPTLGSTKLVNLTPHDLRKVYAERLTLGLSPTTVHQLHAIIHRALGQAFRDGLILQNVADLVTPPRAAMHEMQTLSPAESRTLLAAASADRLEALYVVALSTGLRQGEALALRWADVDLDSGSLQVRGTLQRGEDGLRIESPKTAGSRRKVSLSTSAVDALKRHKVSQNAERLRLGGLWEDMGLVFANEVGRPIEAGNLLRRSFRPLLVKAGLPKMRFHDLRHTAATLLLGKGVHPKIVSEMLGHSKVAITLDLYSHVTPTMQRQATDAMDALLLG